MTISCIVYLGHQSMDTEQVCSFSAVPRIGKSVTLPNGTTHTVKQVIHNVGKAKQKPRVSVILTEEVAQRVGVKPTT